MVRSIDWKRIKEGTHKVVEKASHFETGSGKLITWSSRESRKAQAFLKRLARKR